MSFNPVGLDPTNKNPDAPIEDVGDDDTSIVDNAANQMFCFFNLKFCIFFFNLKFCIYFSFLDVKIKKKKQKNEKPNSSQNLEAMSLDEIAAHYNQRWDINGKDLTNWKGDNSGPQKRTNRLCFWLF